MNNFYKGGRGLCLPDQTVETQDVASPARHIKNQTTYLMHPVKRITTTCTGQGPDGQKSKIGQIGFVLSLTILFFVSLFSNAFAQSRQDVGADAGVAEVTPLMVGQKVPEEFWTREHLFYVNGDTVRKTLDEHRGKMLVLDFWFSGCTLCLLHQEEINHFKKSYPNELAVVMINSRMTGENYDKIATFMDSDRFKRLGLEGLSTIIEDEYLERLFRYASYPTYLWIDSRGVLQLQTFRNLLDRDSRPPFINQRP